MDPRNQKRCDEVETILIEEISNNILDSNQSFSAMCDASNFGIGAALSQSHQGNKKNQYQQTQDFSHKQNSDSQYLGENAQL